MRKSYDFGQNMSKFERSSAFWQDFLKQLPGDATILNNLGNAFHEEGNIEQAVKAYQRAIHIDPSLHVVFYNLAVLNLVNGDYLKAEENCREAIKMDPANAVYHTTLGKIYGAQKEYDRAISLFEKAIKLGDETAANHVAEIYGQRGEFDKSSEAYTKYLELVGYFDKYSPNDLQDE